MKEKIVAQEKKIPGIDPALFEQHSQFDSVVTGLISGRELHVRFKPNLISIKDTQDTRFGFSANIDHSGTLMVGIKTKGFEDAEDRKHPDLFAKQLIQTALIFFERNGNPVKQWYAVWSKRDPGMTDNYHQFAKKAKLLSETEAAKQTWTGQVAQELGFTEVTNITWYPEEEKCFVLFTKPTP